MRFSEKGNIAGNHYHKKKQEQFKSIIGKFRVILERSDTKEQEELILDAQDHNVLYIPSGIAHVVVSDSDIAALLVIATFPNNETDEFSYEITP